MLLPRESLALGRLAADFERAGIESMTLTAGLAAEDFDRLLSVLADQAAHHGALGSLRINVVRPAYRDEESWEQRLTELRRAYASGVTVLRKASQQVAAGEPVDLAAASSVVERLHDEVQTDPGYGLLLRAVRSYDEYTLPHGQRLPAVGGPGTVDRPAARPDPGAGSRRAPARHRQGVRAAGGAVGDGPVARGAVAPGPASPRRRSRDAAVDRRCAVPPRCLDPVGTPCGVRPVRLTSGEIAVVVRQTEQVLEQPTVLVLFDRAETPTEVEERDLAAQADGGPVIAERVDPEVLGVDLPRFVVSGRVHELSPTGGSGGLVHEPAPARPPRRTTPTRTPRHRITTIPIRTAVPIRTSHHPSRDDRCRSGRLPARSAFPSGTALTVERHLTHHPHRHHPHRPLESP